MEEKTKLSERIEDVACKVVNRGAVVGAFTFLLGYILGFCVSKTPLENKTDITNTPSNYSIMFPDHAGYSKLTDIDRDGKWDVLEQMVYGPRGFNRLTYKKDYGPAQSVDAEVKIESPVFFEPYDKCFPIKANGK